MFQLNDISQKKKIKNVPFIQCHLYYNLPFEFSFHEPHSILQIPNICFDVVPFIKEIGNLFSQTYIHMPGLKDGSSFGCYPSVPCWGTYIDRHISYGSHRIWVCFMYSLQCVRVKMCRDPELTIFFSFLLASQYLEK